ncbi:MAG: hypothetical protein HYR72_01135 [Deltaproteobacteria bacterium]|nr:hypothetical protein [Deltaproteobacteria bacterium]MBI3390973.1 hypothetical protein [Deltaproteobacteria bacterium]
MRLESLLVPKATTLTGVIVRTALHTLVVSFLVVTGLSRASQARFPLFVPNWSGKTLLIVNEESFGEPVDEGRNLIALPILNDGTVNPKQGIALANSTTGNQTFESGDPDPVAVTPNGHFAYVQEENAEESGLAFYRFDLQHVDTNGGSGHIKRFTFKPDWQGTGLAVLGNFLYAVVNSDGKELWRLPINPTNGDLGAPNFVVTIADGSGHEATGSDIRLTTDGTCIFASDSGSEFVFKICIIEAPCTGLVSVWADASTGGDAPNIMSDNTIVFGPGNANLFLSQNNEVFTTTGPSGITPGSFTKIFDLPGDGGPENEGSAFTSLLSGQFLYVGNENEEEAYGAKATGTGGAVALSNAFSISGEEGQETGVPGDQAEFDEAEGLAIIDGSPRFGNGQAFFSLNPTSAPTLDRTGLLLGIALLFGVAAFGLRRANVAR